VLEPSDHVVVVGAGFGGWRFVEALRREGFDGTVTLIGDEVYAPYDRPPLSKQVLVGKWDVEKATLATPERIEESRITLLLGSGAVGLDRDTMSVHLADGSTVVGTHIVIATGTRARRLPFTADAHIHTLRSRSDEERLGEDLERLDPGSVVAVIGGGFIGAEVATSLHTRGFRPIVLEALSRPLVASLGEDVSLWLERLAGDVGIELRGNQHINDVARDDEGFTVTFHDGSELAAGAVIVGAGALLNVEWLATSGLNIDNGVIVDADLLATERVAAIGDIAHFSWNSVMGEESIRIEHWEVANMHAARLAHFWATGESPANLMVPYFWSDQYGKKLQMLGHPKPDDDVVRVEGSPEEGKWLAMYSRSGVVTGLIALSQPRALMLSKHFLEVPTTLEEALEQSPWTS
jgi:3-phenylpropionate/trans-cinnamate dioxygenase ferredoxin reductase component